MRDVYDEEERGPLVRALFWGGYILTVLMFLALAFWGPLFL